MVSSAYLRLLLFLWGILIPACCYSSPSPGNLVPQVSLHLPLPTSRPLSLMATTLGQLLSSQLEFYKSFLHYLPGLLKYHPPLKTTMLAPWKSNFKTISVPCKNKFKKQTEQNKPLKWYHNGNRESSHTLARHSQLSWYTLGFLRYNLWALLPHSFETC